MKIAFISQNLWVPWGGSEELWSQTAHVLQAGGHEVLACVARWDPEPPAVAALRAAGCRVHPIGFSSRTFAQKVVHLLRGLPRSPSLPEHTFTQAVVPFAPDLVVISQGFNQDGVVWAEACQNHGLRYALVIQAAIPYYWPSDDDLEPLRRAYRGAAAVYFVSRQNQRLTEEQLALDLPHAAIVSNPFALARDQPITWPDESGGLRLAQVARLEPGPKGQDLLLAVLAAPKWRERPLHVSFYGTGHSALGVRALAAKLGLTRVSFPGQTRDVAGIWQQHHGLILPSRYEGMPLALIEAMLCHRCAIVTDVGGNAELVTHGAHGFVARHPTAESLDETMEAAWSERARWRELGLAAGRHVRAVIPASPPAEFAARIQALVASPS